ncbi:hypothetical protein [Actinophytocola sp.]|uniref:hypothetical protein n=1 Tax=Actinophytocola sp. TaxID=1872138 RepID=UPI0025BD3CC7|nr:hypothetical protein [Actinophytocola sp.]
MWLDWGQALAYRVTFLDGPDEGRATAVTELRGPTRAGRRDDWWKSADYTGAPVTLGPVATPEVSYANRSGDHPAAAAAGWYYLVVKLSPVWTDGLVVPETQPTFEIAVSVSGEPAAGPRYAEVDIPSSAPPSTRSTWTPPSSAAATAAAFGSGSSPFPWWLLGAVGGVVLLAVAVLVVLRRRAGRG